MSTQVKKRRGTESEHSTFTGAIGEVTVNTTTNGIRVHDGATAGGKAIGDDNQLALAEGSTLPRAMKDRFADVVNVRDFGAVGDADKGSPTDDTTAINNAIAYCKSLIVTLPNPDQDYIPVKLVFPKGAYSVSTLNFTEIAGPRNFHVDFQGSVLVGNTAGKTVIDLTGSRWVWFHNVLVNSLESTICKSGIQLGPVGTETCGNNKFFNVQCLGNYSEAAFSNYGSETTQYYSCRFSNNNSSADSYSYRGDGLNLNGYSSDYVTVTRSVGQAVSFTNNYFYSCQLRSLSAGRSVFLSQTNGWNFDQGCYFLTFTGAAVIMYGTATYRNEGITLRGLFETTQAPGIDHCVEFTGDGTQTSINAFTLDTVRPHAQLSYIKNSVGNLVSLPNCEIKVTNPVSGKTPNFFDVGSGLSAWGVIKTAYPEGLNLGDLTNFSGQIIVDDLDVIASLPAPGSAYTAIGFNGGYIQGGKKQEYQDVWNTVPVVANDVAPVYEFSTISSAAFETVNTITNAYSGAQKVTFRFSGSGNVTFVNNSNFIRNNSGADVVLTSNQSVTYVRISGTIWQQV